MASRAPPHPSRLSLTARPPCHWLTAPSLRGGRCAVTTTAVPPWWGRGAHARCTPSPPPLSLPLVAAREEGSRGRRAHRCGVWCEGRVHARAAGARLHAMQRNATHCTGVRHGRARVAIACPRNSYACANGCCMRAVCIGACMRAMCIGAVGSCSGAM